MKGDVGMHNVKNRRNKSLHSKVIVQSLDHGVMYVPSSQNNDKDFNLALPPNKLVCACAFVFVRTYNHIASLHRYSLQAICISCFMHTRQFTYVWGPHVLVHIVRLGTCIQHKCSHHWTIFHRNTFTCHAPIHAIL